MNKVTWTIFAILSVGFLAVLVAFSNNSTLDLSDLDTNSVLAASNKNGNIADHVFGKTDGKVTLVEYGDYQCPPCASVFPTIKSVTEEYKGQLRFVFRNFPIPNLHPNAKAAAAAAEAAGLQDKYWEMHNKIYETQSSWENLSGTERTDFFVGYAKLLGLDTTKFKTDMASSSVNAKISFDLEIGRLAKVNGTPAFFLNGTALDSDTYGDEAKLKEAINKKLTEAGIDLPTLSE